MARADAGGTRGAAFDHPGVNVDLAGEVGAGETGVAGRQVDGPVFADAISILNLEKLQEIVEAARIKPAVVEIESHPYLPEWDLLDYCRQQGIVLLAFAALGHGMEPRLLDDPVIVAIARRLGKTPAQVVLAWAVQRGTALLTTSVRPSLIQENFELSTIPEDAMQEIRDGVATRVRFNTVVGTGVPGFIPRAR